jgi:hypothetical protein
MPVAVFVLAVALAGNAVLGPVGVGLIRWRVSASVLNQGLGIDAATLALAVRSR